MEAHGPIAELRAQRLQRRLGMEELARQLGQERTRAQDELASAHQTIREQLPAALEAGVPLDTYAKLVGVSRQTLYRWREQLGLSAVRHEP